MTRRQYMQAGAAIGGGLFVTLGILASSGQFVPGGGGGAATSATQSFTVNNGGDNTGTSGLIVKGGTTAQNMTLAMRPSQTWPVLTGRPNTTDTCMTYDIFPNGAPATCGPGVAWMDVCDADLIANSSASVHCTRLAATGQIDMVALNGATANSMALAVNGVTEELISNTSIALNLGTTINIASGTAFAITENQNNGTFATVTNTTSGTASFTKLGLSNGTNVGELYHFSPGYTTNGALQANSTALYSTGTNGINLAAAGASAAIRFYAGGIAAGNLLLTIGTTGNLITTGTSPGTPTSCGTSPAYTANSPATDTAARITTGTSNTGCTVPFSVTKTKIPACICTDETANSRLTSCVPSATNLVFTLGANSSDVISYICFSGAGGT